MKRDDVFPSKYLRAADLNGKPIIVRIAGATLEHLKNGKGEEQAKTVLAFAGGQKTLPLNMVNWDSVADIAGDDTGGWVGARIELYPTTTTMSGKAVDCIRIRKPSPRVQPVLPIAEELDDAIPF